MIYFFQNCHTLRKLNFDPLKINCVKSELNILFLNVGWIKVIGPIHNLVPAASANVGQGKSRSRAGRNNKY